MRLYRGVSRPYRPELVPLDHLSGTDFTGCPATALHYARGAEGVLLVADIPERESVPTAPWVTEELWFVRGARRFMVWGAFDSFVTAIVAAKNLRARLRDAGMRAEPASVQAMLLVDSIENEILSNAAPGLLRRRQPG